MLSVDDPGFKSGSSQYIGYTHQLLDLDDLPRFQVAEIKRAVFRALTRLRAATIKAIRPKRGFWIPVLSNDVRMYDNIAMILLLLAFVNYISSYLNVFHIPWNMNAMMPLGEFDSLQEFDTIARLETSSIDAYNDAHHYRA